MKIINNCIKGTIALGLLVIGLLLALNFYGISIKVSKDWQYAAIVLPNDLSIDSFRLVNITVLSLDGEKASWELPKQSREHFQSCYWGEDGNLWIDGEFGIVLTQFENGEWIECPVTSIDEDSILFIDCGGMQGSISKEEVPDAIVKRLE